MPTATSAQPESPVWSDTTVDEFLQDTLSWCRDLFEKEEALPPVAIVLSRIDPRTNMPAEVALVMYPESGLSEETKDLFTAKVARTAKQTSAAGVILALETWQVTAEPNEDVSQWAGRVQVYRLREEGISGSLETSRRGTRTWRAIITRSSDDSPTLGPWEGGEFLKSVTGRFTHLLPECN